MPAPSNPVLDTFDRADGPPGANWAQAVNAYTMPPIVGNALSWPQFPSLYWVTPFGRSQEAFVTQTGAATGLALLMRWHPNGASGVEEGYAIGAGMNGSESEFVGIDRYVNGASSNIYFANFDMDSDTSIWVTLSGRTFTVYGSQDGGVTWTQRTTFTDTSPLAFTGEGFIGLFEANNGTPSALNDFGGGTILTPERASPFPARFGGRGA